MKWNTEETMLIRDAVKRINRGASIYSQVSRLYFGELYYRTWDSIRYKIREQKSWWPIYHFFERVRK